jgi:3-oxoacyl-[acyl-carrier-protein] synthase II
MNVLGTGMIFSGGRGTDSFQDALEHGWQPPADMSGPDAKEKKYAYLVDTEAMADAALLRKMRRADKLSKMAVSAASEALERSVMKDIDRKSIGIITATALGAHVTTFEFLDGILEYGESGASPTSFSNSVHNAAASYISSILGIEGPTLTVTQFFFSFHSALLLAKSWLHEKRCDYVLVGTAEQYGDVMGYVYNQKLRPAPDGRIMPFNFSPTSQVPGEGAVFFLLSSGHSEQRVCRIEDIIMDSTDNETGRADLDIIDTDGLLSDESVYESVLSADIPAASFTPLFGSMMTGSAFNAAAAALMLRNNRSYANPVKDNPRGIMLLNNSTAADIDIELIRCVRYNCYGNKAVIYLRT